MPMLINFLGRVGRARFYDEHEIAQLQIVYDRAREHLAIGITDPRRERLAMLIFEEADSTRDIDELLSRVIARFERLD
jgi:hypothetical protein